MRDKCKIFKKEQSVCDSNASTSSNITTERVINNTSDLAKIISDPTGHGNGKGINKKSESEDFCKSLVTQIQVKIHDKSGKDAFQTITVNKNLVNEIKEIFAEIYQIPRFKIIEPMHTYKYRYAQNSDSSNRSVLSAHAFGCAIDINQNVNPYGRKTSLDTTTSLDDVKFRSYNHKVVKIFTNHGWTWGQSFDDLMHFQKFPKN